MSLGAHIYDLFKYNNLYCDVTYYVSRILQKMFRVKTIVNNSRLVQN